MTKVVDKTLQTHDKKMSIPAIEVEDKTQAIEKNASVTETPKDKVDDNLILTDEKESQVVANEVNEVEEKMIQNVIILIKQLESIISTNNEHKESSNEVIERNKILQNFINAANEQISNIKQGNPSKKDLEEKCQNLEKILIISSEIFKEIDNKKFNVDYIKRYQKNIEETLTKPELENLSKEVQELANHMQKYAPIKPAANLPQRIIPADKALEERIAAFEKIIAASNPESEKPQPVEKTNATKITHFGFGNGDPKSDFLQQEPRARNTTTQIIQSEVLSEKLATINRHSAEDLSRSSIKVGGM